MGASITVLPLTKMLSAIRLTATIEKETNVFQSIIRLAISITAFVIAIIAFRKSRMN